MVDFEDYKNMSNNVYNIGALLAKLTDWKTIDLNELGYTAVGNDNTGYCVTLDDGFQATAYIKDGKIVISLCGTNDLSDINDDLNIINGLAMEQYDDAVIFITAIAAKYGIENIVGITGHSLGGAVAQLIGALYGIETVTFNAPGMEDLATSLGLIYSDNITNYVVMNDYVANYGEHAGTTYYIQPYPIINSALYDTHMCILEYTKETMGELYSSSELNLTQAEGLSLWYYDKNNTLADENASGVASLVSTTALKTAVEKINSVIGTPINVLQYVTDAGEYVIGNAEGNTLSGKTVTDLNGITYDDYADTIWGNEGNDIITGLGGNDSILGGTDNDSILGGEGNDTIYGGQGADTILGEAGNDFVYGGTGNDYLQGGDGSDKIYGNEGNDILVGGAGTDYLYGADGDDYVTDGQGSDIIFDTDGNDTYFLTYDTSSHTDQITDIDGIGSINAGGTIIAGGNATDDTNTTFTDSNGFTYTLSASGLKITSNGYSCFINTFANGDLGINLKDFDGDDIEENNRRDIINIANYRLKRCA